MLISARWSGQLGIALLVVSTCNAFAQVSTATQRFVGADIANPVLAVELDAAPDRRIQSPSRLVDAGLPSSAGGGVPGGYGARMEAQVSPPTFTGIGGAAGSIGAIPRPSESGSGGLGR